MDGILFFFPIYFVTRVDFNTSYTGEMVIQFDGPALKQQQKKTRHTLTHTHTQARSYGQHLGALTTHPAGQSTKDQVAEL